MRIEDFEVGKEYRRSHAYGQPEQRVVCQNIEEEKERVWFIYLTGINPGKRDYFNRIECERYIHEVTGIPFVYLPKQ